MIYVVPSLKAKEKLQSEGKAWAESQGFTYVLRHQRTIQDLMDEYGEDFLVYSSRGPQIDRPEGSHFFSLNMAELRIQNLRKGQRDHLLEALMGMKEREGRTPQSAALTAPLRRGGGRGSCRCHAVTRPIARCVSEPDLQQRTMNHAKRTTKKRPSLMRQPFFIAIILLLLF